MQAVAILLPYVHGRMPASVQADQPARVHLVLAGPEVIVRMATASDGTALS